MGLKNIILVFLLAAHPIWAGEGIGNDGLPFDYHTCNLLTATETENFKITSTEIEYFFSRADTITPSEAVAMLEIPTVYYVHGHIGTERPVDFYLFPCGAGIVISDSVVFLRGEIEIPGQLYEPYPSGIRVLAYRKESVDGQIVEQWARGDEYGFMYREGGEIFEFYKNWEQNVFVNEIHKAFELCVPTPRYPLNVQWNVDHYCNIKGLALRDGNLQFMSMNGGGVICLRGVNEKASELFGCWDPAGKAYFTQILTVED